MDRVYNVEENWKRKASDAADGLDSPKKRGRSKRVLSMESRYPAVRQVDGPVVEQITLALSKEMEKEKPRKDVVLSLMKSTFGKRRQYILCDEGSVTAKLDKFPALRMPPAVSNFEVYDSEAH